LTLPPPTPFEHSELHQRVLDALAPGGAWFFRQLCDQVAGQARGTPRDGSSLASSASVDDQALAGVLWDLVWAGRVSNDTLAPLRALVRRGKTAHRTRQAPGRSRTSVSGRPRMPSRGGPPETAGRWAILPALDDDPTRRAHAVAERLLDRHGVVTRGAVVSERVPGGFAAVYKVLSAFEETGRCRRGYFVATLGAAQFGAPGAVDRLRSYAELGVDAKPVAVALAATDPANPYGAALPWPLRPDRGDGAEGSGHRPGRKAGAIVVLVDGALTLYVERGGKTLLSYGEDPVLLAPAVAALTAAARAGVFGRIEIERVDGAPVRDTPLGAALADAGFSRTYKGLRLRA
jgi:ATP-dependent Lhr-like helicase